MLTATVTEPPIASVMRCARSTLVPRYSFFSSLETWASLTPRRSASWRWVSPLAIRRALRLSPIDRRLGSGMMSPCRARSYLDHAHVLDSRMIWTTPFGHPVTLSRRNMVGKYWLLSSAIAGLRPMMAFVRL